MTSSDTDTFEGEADTGSEGISPLEFQEAQQAREKAQDAKLERHVRDAYDKVSDRQARSDPDSMGKVAPDKTIDETLADTYAKISRRASPVTMPLKANATADEAVDSAAAWATLPAGEKQFLANRVQLVADIRSGAERMGLTLSDADVLKNRARASP